MNIDEAIQNLINLITEDVTPIDALQYSQAAQNMAHVKELTETIIPGNLTRNEKI